MKTLVFRRSFGFILLIILSLAILASCTSPTTTTKATTATTTQDLSPVEFELFINHTWFATNKFEGIIPDEIKKETGCSFNATLAADANQLPVMIASGDLPELVYTSRELGRLSTSQLCYSWNELIAQYAPDFQIEDVRISNSKAFSQDDNFYTILNYYSPKADWDANPNAIPGVSSGLVVRKDIMEALGNPALNTLADYLSILEKVKTQYPDMIPLIFDADWKLRYFKEMCGVDRGMVSNSYVDNAGKVSFYITDPDYLTYLKYCNEMYRKGYIIAENFAYKTGDDLQYVYDGTAFSKSAEAATADYTNSYFEKEGSPIRFMQVTKALSDKYIILDDMYGWSGVFVTKNCKNPARAIQMLKWMFSDHGQKLSMWGREGIEWNMSAEGYPVFSEDWQATSADWTAFCTKYNNQFAFGRSAIIEGFLSYNPKMEQTLAMLKTAKAATIMNSKLLLIQPGVDTDQATTISKLNELVNNEESRIILLKSEAEVEAAYNEMLETAKQIGLTDIENYLTDKYAAIK